jgi:thiol-disulfide isomerase/thioredoxin
VIAFFASWCGPCRLEAPALERFATSPIGRGQMIAVDYGDVPARARAFIARYHWSFPVLSDPSTAFGDAYGVAHLPTTVILDANGRIVARDYGAQTIASLDRAFRAARSLS